MSSPRLDWTESAWLEESRQSVGDTGTCSPETLRDLEDTDVLLRAPEDDDDEACLLKDNNGSVNVPAKARSDTKCCYFPHRFRLLGLVFSGLVLLYCTRVNFNVALVAMVNFTSANAAVNSSDRCPGAVLTNTTKHQNEGGFDWSPAEQSFLLQSFYYGYVVLQMPAGYLAERFSSKLTMGLAIVLPGLVNLLMPLAAHHGVAMFGALRVLCGLLSGVAFPSMMVIWAHWAPKFERTWLVGITLVGMNVGNVVSFSISGILCNSNFLGGWPSVFYVFGGLCCAWGVLWAVFMYDSPTKDPTISQEEKEMIIQNTDSVIARKYGRPPLKAILTSPAVWALWIVMTTDSFGFYVFNNDIDLYLSQVLGFDIQKDGLISSLPFVCNFIGSITLCPLVDVARRKGILSTKTARKIATCIGEFGLAVCLFLIGMFFECDTTTAVILLMVGQFLNAFAWAGFGSNCLDIAPMYAGIIIGVGNTTSNIMGFLTPILVEQLTGNSASRSSWRMVFYVTSGILAGGGVIFGLFAKGEQQAWARQPGADDDDDHQDPKHHDSYGDSQDPNHNARS